jgi:hypothetical protein
LAAVSAYAQHAITASGFSSISFYRRLLSATQHLFHLFLQISLFLSFLTFQLFDPDFQSHAPLIDLNYASYNNPSAIHDFTLWAFFFEAQTPTERISDPVCIAVMYGIATTQMSMFRQCKVIAKWIRSTAIAISCWPRFLVRHNRIRELPEKFLDFPCTCPIPDLTQKTSPFAFMLDAILQTPEFAAKYHILPESNVVVVSSFKHDGRYLLSSTTGQKSFEPSPT